MRMRRVVDGIMASRLLERQCLRRQLQAIRLVARHHLLVARVMRDELPCSAPLGAGRATKQVPTVSLNIQEYRHLSIRLNTRSGDEPDARGAHPRVRRFEIINAQEETDPPGTLLAHGRQLTFAIGAREQNAGSTADRTNNDPALRATVIRQRRNVLHELELQNIHKEVDRGFILPHNQGNQLEMRHQLGPDRVESWHNFGAARRLSGLSGAMPVVNRRPPK